MLTVPQRRLVIAGIVLAVFLVVVALVASTGSKRPALVRTTPSAHPTVKPSATAEPEEEDPEEEIVERQVANHGRQPIIKALPHSDPNWYLEYRGSTGGVYHVHAFVFYAPGEDATAKLAQQKPAIEAFVQDTGQPAGTYTIEYESRLVEQD